MSHVRTQIRNAVAAELAGIAPVHVARVYPVDEADLPVLLVYTNGEQLTGDTFGNLARSLEVVVEIVAQTAALDDAMDALLAQVEQALAGGLAMATSFLPTEIDVTTSADGSAPIGRLRLTYEATYRTSFADPETSL